MRVKKGDNVIIVAGKDKGKTATILRAFPRKNLVVVDGLNLRKKHQKIRRDIKQGNKGIIIDIAVPMHASNVMVIDPKTNKRSRISKTFDEKKKQYVRTVKSGTPLA